MGLNGPWFAIAVWMEAAPPEPGAMFTMTYLMPAPVNSVSLFIMPTTGDFSYVGVLTPSGYSTLRMFCAFWTDSATDIGRPAAAPLPSAVATSQSFQNPSEERPGIFTWRSSSLVVGRLLTAGCAESDAGIVTCLWACAWL